MTNATLFDDGTLRYYLKTERISFRQTSMSERNGMILELSV